MSPLRRLWLAWGGWGLAAVLGWLGLLWLLAGMKLGLVGGEFPTVAERPFAIFLFVALPLGLRLRSLLSVDCLAMARGHAVWVLRGFSLVILPLVAVGMALPLILTGVPALWSLAIAAALAAVGAWIGFAMLLSIPAVATAFALVSVLGLVSERSSRLVDALALVLLVMVGAGVRLAWRRLETRVVSVPWRDWCPWRSWRLERLMARFDAWSMPALATVAARRRPVSLLTAARVGLSGLGGSWRMRLAGMLLMAIGAAVVSWQAADLRDRLPIALSITTLIAFVSAAWLSVARVDAPHLAGHGRHRLRGFLASQRLLPLSRRQAAGATMLVMIGNGLSNVLPAILGMLLGLLLADACLGRDPGGLWLMLPQAVAVVVCCSAGMLLSLCMPTTLAIALAVLLTFILLTAPIVVLHFGGSGYPGVATIACGLAVLLAPLAWWRLAEVELP